MSLKNKIETQLVRPLNKSAYAHYSVLADNAMQRSELRDLLLRRGVPTATHYHLPLHLQPIFNNRYKQGDLPIAEEICRRIINLPIHPYLTVFDILRATEAIGEMK